MLKSVWKNYKAYWKNNIRICFIQPGKPTQNSLIEPFNGVYRKEVLNLHLFTDLNQVRDETQSCMYTYNHIRPHESLNNEPSIIFIKNRRKNNVPSFMPDNNLMKESIINNVSV